MNTDVTISVERLFQEIGRLTIENAALRERLNALNAQLLPTPSAQEVPEKKE
jgi:regulator of replication initiation timing